MAASKTNRRRPGKRPRFPNRLCERDEPRSVPDCRAGEECQSNASRLPARPLDGFIIHDPDSFDPGRIWTPQISEEQWEAARLLLAKGYVLGVCANPEEAVVLAACASVKIPQHTLFAYDEDEMIVWLTMA